MHHGWGPAYAKPSTSLTATTASNSEMESKVNVDSNKVTTADILSLDSIRSTLIRQEETIIFAIIERAQYRHNSIVYQNGGFGDLGVPLGSNPDYFENKRQKPLSFLEYMLIGTVS
jgi:hypothetical protein